MTPSRTQTNEIRIYFKKFAREYSGVTDRDLEEIFDLIIAPLDLQRLFLVLRNLPSILPLTKKISEEANDLQSISPKLDSALATTNKLLEQYDRFKNNLILDSLIPIEGEEIERQLYSKLESHPLYCCLAISPPGTDDHDQIQKQNTFLAQIFVATHNLPGDFRNDKTKLKNNFLAARTLCKASHTKLISLLPKVATSPQVYLETLQRHDEHKLLSEAERILKLSLRRSKGAPQKAIPLEPKSPLDEEDTEHNLSRVWTGDNKISAPLLSPEEEEHYIIHGGSEKELTTGWGQIPVPCPDNRRYSHITRRDLAIQARHRSNHLAHSNQLSPLSWDELNQFDISILIKLIHGEEETDIPAVLKIVLGTMFLASMSIERTARLYVLQKEELAHNSPEGIYWSSSQTPFIRLRSPGPNLSPKSRLITSKLAHKVIYYSHIPLADIFCDAVENSISERLNSNDPTTLIEPSQVEKTITELKKIFSNLNSRHGCRLSLSRIQSYFVNALSREPYEDIPSSMLFFGQPPERFIARMHYTCSPLQRIERSYRNLAALTFSEILRTTTFRNPDPVNPDARLGTPYCPRKDAVQNLVKSLHTVLNQARPRGNKTFKKVKNFHNHYAIYTSCLIAFSTCYRAIHDPSFDEKEIDFKSGLGIISDKDDKTHYHSRMVTIPAVCQEQIRNYRRHLNYLYDYFSKESPAIFNIFKNYCSPESPLNLFYLSNDDEKTVLLKPSTLSPHLAAIHNYDLPVNANRHYIKNELQDRGCSPELYEAQLGHWETGQEPWNRFSNLDPVVFSERMQSHLDAILERDGWLPIKGLSP